MRSVESGVWSVVSSVEYGVSSERCQVQKRARDDRCSEMMFLWLPKFPFPYLRFLHVICIRVRLLVLLSSTFRGATRRNPLYNLISNPSTLHQLQWLQQRCELCFCRTDGYWNGPLVRRAATKWSGYVWIKHVPPTKMHDNTVSWLYWNPHIHPYPTILSHTCDNPSNRRFSLKSCAAFPQ